MNGGYAALTSGSDMIDAAKTLADVMGLDKVSSWPDSVLTLNQNDYGGGWEFGAYVYTDTTSTCQSLGYQCCSSCESGPHPEYDADCSGQVCCEVCSTTNELIAWWTMDLVDISGTTLFDKSGNSNDGTIYGAVSTTGRISQALYFDGVNDYLETNYLNHLPYWSVGVWVKGDNLPGSDRDTGPVMKQENFLISWDHSGSSFRGAASIRVGGIWYPSSFGTLNANTWYHLTATYDGETLKAYKNGQLITSNTNPSGNSDSSTYSMKIGRHAVNDDYFNGAIDEVRIYNYALSSQEVLALYNAGQSICSPADTNTDGTVDIIEIINYMASWKAGSVTIENLMIGIGEWKNGCD